MNINNTIQVLTPLALIPLLSYYENYRYYQRYNLTTFPNMLGHQDITAVDDITPKIKDVVDSGHLDYDDVDKDGDDDVDSMLMMVTLQDHIFFCQKLQSYEPFMQNILQML